MTKWSLNRARASLMRAGMLAVAFFAAAGISFGSAKVDQEHELKAAFIANFIRFIDWPDLGAPGSRFVVGIYGADDYQDSIQNALAGKSVLGHPIVVEQLHSDSDIKHCKIVVSGASSEDRVYHLSRLCDGTGTVLVGDAPDFVQNGGTFGFLVINSRIRFDVNLDEAKRSGVNISSKLLQLAHEVYREGDE